MSERPWTWREAGAADREDQCRLFNACFRKDKQVDTFDWKYAKNPHGPAISRVAVDGRGKVVGAYSYVPRRFRRDGQPLLLMQASDAMVAPEARRQGIFTGLDDIVCEAAGEMGIPWVFAYSGRLSYTGFLGNGWEDIGQASVFRYGYRSERGLRRLGRVAPLAAQLAPLLDGWRFRRDRKRFEAWHSPLTRVARFDGVVGLTESVDELCEAAMPCQGLVGERDAAWLNWRYVDTPSGRQECYVLPAPGEAVSAAAGGARAARLDGLLVVEFHGGNAFLVDHVARDEAARRELLLAFTAMGHARGMLEATALCFLHHPAAATLRELGWPEPSGSKLFRDRFPFIVRACRKDARPEDGDISRWHLADGDRDAEHLSA